ncbi:MAG TPA: flagellar basal body-associated FliL family protein [Candidatus Sumerlaeota bacterium]|nr:flagellar basal body-associated FliL family protein [Candidatus Sumerlaeota bacterium]
MWISGKTGLVWALALSLAGGIAGCGKSGTSPSTPTGKTVPEASKAETEGTSEQEDSLEAALEQRATPAATSREPSAPESKSGPETVAPDFDPFLFRHRDRTLQYVVEIPPRKEEPEGGPTPTPTPIPRRLGVKVVEKFPEVIKVNLKDKSVVRVRVAVECADEETMKALEASAENRRLVQEAVENRTSDELLTLQGKMAFKDDLIAKLKASLNPQVRGIKEVHLMEFSINVH